METMDLRCSQEGLVLCVTTFVKKDVALQTTACSDGILCYDSVLAPNDTRASSLHPCGNSTAVGMMCITLVVGVALVAA